MPHTSINTRRLVPTSRLVANVTGIHVQRNKAIVGQNAFAHEAGIHQDGMLKERTTYEIMRPEDVGFATTELVLGKHSGRAALANRIKALGYPLGGEQVQTSSRPSRSWPTRREIYDADIAALIEQRDRQVPGTVDACLLRGHLRHRPIPRVRSPPAPRAEEVASRSPAATARSTRSSWPSRS